MKTYEKPRLVALSLNGDDRLCGDCAGKNDLIYNNLLLRTLLGDIYGDCDGDLTREEYFEHNLFGTEECEEAIPGYSNYCKFSSTEEGFITIAWS